MMRVLFLVSSCLLFAQFQFRGAAGLNCYVSPPDANYPYIPPYVSPAGGTIPPIVMAYNTTGGQYQTCAYAYLSYHIPDRVNVSSTNASIPAVAGFKSYNGYIFLGNAVNASTSACEASTDALISSWVSLNSGLGSTVYLKSTGSTCCATDQCNNPATIPTAAMGERQQPRALAILASALMGAILLSALWA